MSDDFRYQPETTHGVTPPLVTTTVAGLKGKEAARYFDGGAQFDCPTCGAMCDTADALTRAQLPNGLRFQGVPCHYCGTSFTAELTQSADVE